jgi:hypothetical protein
MRSPGVAAVVATVAVMCGTSARAAGGDEGKQSFNTLDGWQIRPFPAVQLARIGVTRQTASLTGHQDFTVDVLQGIGLGVSFNPPWKHFRSRVYNTEGQLAQKQWLGFSLFSILKGGSMSNGRTLLEGTEIGFGASLDFLELLSLGAGVDLYRGVSADGHLFHTGILPALYGAGHFTREDVFVSLSINIGTTLFGGSSGNGSGGGAK